jgi:hypothetical protein
MCCRYMAVQGCAPWIMKIWVPAIIFTITLACILIEFRVGVQYYAAKVGVDWAVDTFKDCQKD